MLIRIVHVIRNIRGATERLTYKISSNQILVLH